MAEFDREAFAASLISNPETVPEPAGETDDGTAADVSDESASPDDQADASSDDTAYAGDEDAGDSAPPQAARPEDGDGAKPDAKSSQTVPLHVAAQYRQEAAQVKQAYQQLAQQHQQLLNHLQSQQQGKTEQPKSQGIEPFQPSISEEEDPVRYLKERLAWTEKNQGFLAQHLYDLYNDNVNRQKQQQQLTQQQQQEQQFKSHVQNLEHQYRQENPQYDGALTYMRNKRVHELQAQAKASNADPDSPEVKRWIQQNIVNEFTNYSRQQLQAGLNPAASLYNLAVAYGYQEGKQPAKKTGYDRALKGQAASQSVAAMPGGSPQAKDTDENATPSGFGSLVDFVKKDLYGKRR